MFAEKLRACRLAAHLSQQQLADAMGVSRTAVYKWEMDQGQPDIAKLAKLAGLFHISIDELCGQPVRPTAPVEESGNIGVMTRAFRQLTEDEQEKYLAVGRALFAHAFEEGDGR